MTDQTQLNQKPKKGKWKKIITIIVEFLLIVAFLASLSLSDDPIYLLFGIVEISENMSFILPFAVFIFALVSGFGTLMYIIIKRVEDSLDTLELLLLVLDLTFGTLAMINIFFDQFTFGVFSILISTYLLFIVFIYMLKRRRFMIYLVYTVMGFGFVYLIVSVVFTFVNIPYIQLTEPLTGFIISIILPVFFVWLTVQPIEFIEREERSKR